jgi:DNA-binding MarR family transcriptional regulator
MKDGLSALKHIDRIIHEPARLIIVVILSTVEESDFLYLLRATELTKGNLSSHLSRLEDAGYVNVKKSFVGKTPRTVCNLTEEGRIALETYRSQLKAVI